MIPDTGIKYLFSTILRNNRLCYFEAYILNAINNNYVVTSFIDFLEDEKKYSGRKVLILRHDVDISPAYARRMYEIEKKIGVKSTYYFRWSTFDYEFIQELNQNGYEVGFHYETIASYCEEKGITHVDGNILKECRQRLKDEIAEFNKKANLKIKTIASHGHPKNILLKVSNNVLLSDRDYEAFGITSEAYDEVFYRNCVQSHIADCDILTNYGFIYDTNPMREISAGKTVIVFSAHPVHWYYEPKKQLINLIRLILGKYTTAPNKEFIRIAGNSL